VSQISAAVLPATTEQLALVAALRQRADDARTPRLGMPAALLEYESEVLPDELRTRDAALPRSAGEQAIVLRVERNGGRLLPWNAAPVQKGTRLPFAACPGSRNVLISSPSPHTVIP